MDHPKERSSSSLHLSLAQASAHVTGRWPLNVLQWDNGVVQMDKEREKLRRSQLEQHKKQIEEKIRREVGIQKQL